MVNNNNSLSPSIRKKTPPKMGSIAGSGPVTERDIENVKNAPFAYRNDTWKKPIADDYKYALKYNFPLPSHGQGAEILDFTVEDENNKQKIADTFLKELERIIQSRDAKAFADLFLDSGMSDISHFPLCSSSFDIPE